MVMSVPVNILTSIISGYFTTKNPFKFLYQATVACVFFSSYYVLVFLYWFPFDKVEQQSNVNLFHMVVITLCNEISTLV